MFGLFKKKLSINECANAAEILPVVENGDYKAFVIRMVESSGELTTVLKSEGGEKSLGKFISIVDDRIERGDFDDVFDVADQMSFEHGLETKKRNINVDRVVVCKDSTGYIFKWNPSD